MRLKILWGILLQKCILFPLFVLPLRAMKHSCSIAHICFEGEKNEVEITYPVSSEKGSSPSKPGSSLTMVCEATMPGKTNRTRTIKHIELTKLLHWNKFLAILAFCGAITRRNWHPKWTRSHFCCNIVHFNTMLP